MLANLNNRSYGIIVLTLATALIHLILGFRVPDTLFILNGLGYIALLIGLYFVPQLAGMRSLIRWAFILYTAVTIILFFVFQGADAFSSVLGLVTKVIELALIVLLWLDRGGD